MRDVSDLVPAETSRRVLIAQGQAMDRKQPASRRSKIPETELSRIQPSSRRTKTMSIARTTIHILAAVATFAATNTATSRPAEAGGRGFGFAFGAAAILANRIKEREADRPHAYRRDRDECYRCYQRPEPRALARTSRDDDDDDSSKRAARRAPVVAKKADDEKPAAIARVAPMTAPVVTTKPAAVAVPAPATAKPPATSADPQPFETASAPAQAEPEVQTDLTAPLVEGEAAPATPAPVRTAGVDEPAVVPGPEAGQCKRFFPSIDLTLTVPCTQ
jgi:hypothetical protein